MGELAPLLSYGVPGVLALVIVYLLSGNRADRAQHVELVDAAERRADAAARRREALDEMLTDARAARRKAEDAAADLAREVHGLREQVEQLRREVAGLRAQLGGPS